MYFHLLYVVLLGAAIDLLAYRCLAFGAPTLTCHRSTFQLSLLPKTRERERDKSRVRRTRGIKQKDRTKDLPRNPFALLVDKVLEEIWIPTTELADH